MSRSQFLNAGLAELLRRSTTSWCRSVSISASSVARDWNNPINVNQSSLQISTINSEYHPICACPPTSWVCGKDTARCQRKTVSGFTT